MLALVLAAPSVLPLKRLVLYENGLGYFERQGQLSAGATAEIPLGPGQLDDALKSLVVVSPRGIASVEYSPALSEAAARASAGLPSDENQASVVGLLRALKGVEVRVAVAAGAERRGRIVEIEETTTKDKDGAEHVARHLLLFGESGLLRLSVEQVSAVAPVELQVKAAWARALEAQTARPEAQRLLVRASSGGGLVGVGYSTEAPVWRTTYRLVMGSGAPRLQGYALVHNDSDERWSGVHVTLASGHPTSFLIPLAGPRYGRRELVELNDGLVAEPQLTSEEAQIHLRGSGGGESAGIAGLRVSGYGSGGGGAGSGVNTGHVTSTVQSSLLADGPTPIEPAAVSEAGELFLYAVKEPVQLAAHKSALLPIVDSRTAVEEVSVVGANDVMLGLRITNQTGLTLEEGTLSVFIKGVYAGEARIDRVKPDEVRVVRHQEDLDLEVDHRTETEFGPVKATRVVKNRLELHRVDVFKHALTVTSRSSKPRVLLVELEDNRSRVTQGAQEDVRSPGQPRFARLQVQAKYDGLLAFVEEGAVMESLSAEAITTQRLDALLTAAVAPAVRQQLKTLRGRAEAIERETAQAKALEGELTELEKEGQRVRASLSAAGHAKSAAADELGTMLVANEHKHLALMKEQARSAASLSRLRRELLAGW